MMGLEIAHADGAHEPVEVERLERAPRLLVRALPFGLGALRSGPVDEVQVDVVEVQLGARFLERLERRIVAAIGVPHLRGDEQVLARYASRGERLAYRALVVVGCRRVDMAIPVMKSLMNGIDPHFPIGHLPRAEPQAGNAVSVSQGDPILRALQIRHACSLSLIRRR